ncbi:uncharacterized protein M421DRAFT_361259 [Didymella exigua CBS 183.55]|uniref:C2H2-type domain-containing protein n=1 Tax=Didymella exigua CBS 183.55 TaxID=1150837 RepID=A0A6A5RU13_9PLEO|nr:uncharacterized protein M421DRAFT_361259 [Didymella exigua CBS 183.55]KAF1930860.1 hypothetical protein M421DRAFT_361259 [Didymella exigua CBS 183.55]
MRLLIQSNNRWSFELTSTKHHTLDCSIPHRESIQNTLASPISETGSTTRSSNSKGSIISSVAVPNASEQKIETDCHFALSRRESIRKRLSRLFVHFRRAPSAPSQEIFEYRYRVDASELPAGGTPITGSAPLEEMPASFPQSSLIDGETFELEQPQPYTSTGQFCAMIEPYNECLLSSRQGCGKQEFAGDLTMYQAPLQVATPKSLPRLAVPGSMQNVPAMTYDQSPHSASTISPNTPLGRFGNRTQPHWILQSGPPLVSPCDTASTLPWYHPQPQHYQMQRSFESPLTPSSTNSSNSATLSAQPQSASATFGAWPQPGPEYLRTAFPQRYQPINHESNTHSAPSYQPCTWATNAQCCHHDLHTGHQTQALSSERNTHLSPQYVPPPREIQGRKQSPAYNESQFLPAIHMHDTTASFCHTIEGVPPPAYSPLAASPAQYSSAICEHCNKIFTGKYGKGNLTRHMRQIHESLMGGAIHPCRFCMKAYNRADALRKHSWKKHRDEDSRPNKRRRS